MHPARGLKAWEAADRLADDIQTALDRAPRGHNRLREQLVSAAESIGGNIAEGSGRGSIPDRRRFFYMALASAQETENWLRRAKRAKLFDVKTYLRLSDRTAITHALLSALIRSLDDRAVASSAVSSSAVAP